MVETIENQLFLNCQSLKDLPTVAKRILNFSGRGDIVIFKGQLGAGKTTLIKELCKELGIEDNVTSPSFSIINEYMDGNSEHVYHFDFYRIKEVEEATNIGVEEYFYSGKLCFIEWPEKVEDLLPDAYTSIEIEVTGLESRTFHLKKHD